MFEEFCKDLEVCIGTMNAISKMSTLTKPYIKKVIFNDPATIVFWDDGTKTVVKCRDETFDKEKGLAMAISKKLYGNNKGNYYDIFKVWCEEEDK